jgi:hypothetical protein
MPDDVVTPEMRAVLDALGAHAELQEWWRTEQPNVTVVVLRDDNAIQLTTSPAWMPNESPHVRGDNLYPRPLPSASDSPHAG